MRVLDRYSQSYGEIAAGIVAALPAGWIQTWVRAEMRIDTGLVVGFFLDAKGEAEWIEVPAGVYTAFRRMHGAAVQSGDPAHVWTSATMALSDDGSFKVDYGYEPVPVEEEDERIDAWMKRSVTRP